MAIPSSKQFDATLASMVIQGGGTIDSRTKAINGTLDFSRLSETVLQKLSDDLESMLTACQKTRDVLRSDFDQTVGALNTLDQVRQVQVSPEVAAEHTKYKTMIQAKILTPIQKEGTELKAFQETNVVAVKTAVDRALAGVASVRLAPPTPSWTSRALSVLTYVAVAGISYAAAKYAF